MMNIVLGILGSFKWLTVFTMLLCILNMIVLIWYAVPIQRHYRWFDFAPGLGVLTAVGSIAYGDLSEPAILIYGLTLIVFLCTVKKVFKPVHRIRVPKFRALRVIICLCGMIPIITALMYAGELRYNPVSDLKEMSYTQAFAAMNERLSVEYPFGDWKKINWIELKQKYMPNFEKAEKEHNKDLYYKTLREYLFSFRDGHVKIVNDHVYDGNSVFKSEVGGGFGLSTVPLDNGKVMVSLVLKDTPAEKSGIKVGAEIISWKGKDAKEALVHTFWSETPSATDDAMRINQGRFMVRGPVGQEIQVEFRNTDDREIKKVKLTAYDDNYESLKQTRAKINIEDALMDGKILNNGYGYVKIRHFLPDSIFSEPEQVFADQLKLFQDKHVKGLIIDLRDNPGGEDRLAAKMAGYLVNQEKFYESVSYYNRNTEKFEMNRLETIIIQPSKPNIHSNIAILVNSRTGSSGEGIPLALKGTSHVKSVGFTSTAGSFGLMSKPIEIQMPEGYVIQFPDGRSLNENQVIQGDSDDSGQGGAVPDIKVPLNEETFKQKYLEGQDVELNYAIEALEKMR